jgi:hypothetical protein
VSEDQKEVDGLLTFARRGESGDGTLGKNLCGWEGVDPKFEVASMFELLLPPMSMVNIVFGRKDGRSFRVTCHQLLARRGAFVIQCRGTTDANADVRVLALSLLE